MQCGIIKYFLSATQFIVNNRENQGTSVHHVLKGDRRELNPETLQRSRIILK